MRNEQTYEQVETPNKVQKVNFIGRKKQALNDALLASLDAKNASLNEIDELQKIILEYKTQLIDTNARIRSEMYNKTAIEVRIQQLRDAILQIHIIAPNTL